MTALQRILAGTALAAFGAPAAAQDPEFLVFDWSGYEDPGFWQAYVDKHGKGPSYSFFGEEEEAFQKLRSGFRADVAHPCSQSVEKWRDAGLIEPFDISRIPAYGDIDQSFTDSDVFTVNGEVYFIPVDFGATAILYNSDEVPVSEVSTLEVFNDPKYTGRISLPDNVDDIYALAYLATGTSDWTKATMDDFKKASAWLRAVHPSVRAYWADGAELSQLMATGEVLISWAWNETLVQLRSDGYPVAFQREAKEGSSTWFCGYVNLVDGPGSEDKVYDFMNAWMEQGSADYIVNEWGYGHSNKVAMSNIDQEVVNSVGMGPIDVPNLAQLPMDNALRELMIAEFEKIKVGF